VTARGIPDVGLDVPPVLAGTRLLHFCNVLTDAHPLNATGPKRPLQKVVDSRFI
jgi:hypothetical protein